MSPLAVFEHFATLDDISQYAAGVATQKMALESEIVVLVGDKIGGLNEVTDDFQHLPLLSDYLSFL